MPRPRSLPLLCCIPLLAGCAVPRPEAPAPAPGPAPLRPVPAQYASAKPWTRWWWFAGEVPEADIVRQLDWVAANGFGGVELAFVYPYGGDTKAPRLPWSSPAFAARVAFARAEANRRGLGCDLTFGTLWPFGDSAVPEADGAWSYGEHESGTRMRLTWEHPVRGRVLNHLDHEALRRYGDRLGAAFAPALATGLPASLFCDSWEVDTKWLWTAGLGARFRERFGYAVEPFVPELLRHPDVLHDWFALVSDLVCTEFYGPFTQLCHDRGATSRVQCGGAPADLLAAFSRVDVPETEAILYEPEFSRIPASAAAATSAPLVSAESFTCLYGWKGWPGPGPHQGEERVGDLKLVADALFAHGTNQIVWHGMPWQSANGHERFYASVHVGPDSGFAAELPAFNRYLTKVSEAMRRGRVYSDVAVVLPVDDAWSAGEYPKELQFPWVWGQYEMRYVKPAAELAGRQPLWVGREFLRDARWEGGRLVGGALSFGSLYVDVERLELGVLRRIVELARAGLPVCCKRVPQEAGHVRHAEFADLAAGLLRLPNVQPGLRDVVKTAPLLTGDDLPDAWCREDDEGLLVFFADPTSRGLKYALVYNQSERAETLVRRVVVHAYGRDVPVELRFAPHQSLLLRVGRDGAVRWVDVGFEPGRPVH